MLWHFKVGDKIVMVHVDTLLSFEKYFGKT